VDQLKELLEFGHIDEDAEYGGAYKQSQFDNIGDDFGDEGSEIDSDEEKERRPPPVVLAPPVQSGRRVSICMNPNLNKFEALQEEED